MFILYRIYNKDFINRFYIEWFMGEKLEYVVKIHKTTDNKKLSTGEKKAYNYGTINIRKPELAKFIGQKVKVKLEVVNG